MFVAAVWFEANSQVTAELESNELLMGNKTALKITVDTPNDSSKVSFPLIEKIKGKKNSYVSLLNDTVEVAFLNENRLTVDNKAIVEYKLNIQAFDSGEYVLPPFELLVDNEPMASNELRLKVIPVMARADDQIDAFTDVADPFEINPYPEIEKEAEEATFIWWLIAVAFLLLTFIGYLLYKYLKTGKVFTKKPVPVYQQALTRLEKLRKMNLPKRGKYKDYYTQLIDILRFYLNKRFGIRSHEKSTTEVLQTIDEKKELEPYRDELRHLLQLSDLVKFAKELSTEEECDANMAEVVEFVNSTRPTAEETENPGNGKRKGGGR